MNLATTVSIFAGGVGSGRHKEIYHATLSRNISSIKKEGLIPQKGKTNFSELAEGKVFTGNKSAMGDVVDGLKEKYPNEEISIIQLKVPEKMLSKNKEFEPDGFHPDAEQYTSKEIPAKYIVKVIKAGGDGSGCHGPNCGRPSTGTKAQQVSGKNWLRMSPQERQAYLREHTQTGDKPAEVVKPKTSPAERIYPHSGRGSLGVGKKPGIQPEERSGKITGPAGANISVERPGNISPLYKKSMDEADIQKEKANQAEMRQWQQRNQPQSNKETNIHEGDLVKTTKPTRAFNNDTLEFQNYKAGTVLTVHNVLPKVGNNVQLISVQFPDGDMVHLSTADVKLHRTYESQQEKPYQQIRQEIGLDKIRPSKIEQQTKTSTGVTYTRLKEEKRGRPVGSGSGVRQPLQWKAGQPNPNNHPLKGQFQLATGPRGNKLNDIFTFDLGQRSNQLGQGTARASVFDATSKSGNGTTVIAWRDTTNKTGKVVEFNKDKNGYIKLGSQPPVSFSNIGHMGTYLKERFGISMKLPGQSVAKRGKKK